MLTWTWGRTLATLLIVGVAAGSGSALAQVYGTPDRGEGGDEMIQAYLSRLADTMDEQFLSGVKTQEDWDKLRPQYVREYLYMLGLWPTPARTPLKATVTGTLRGDGYAVDMLHYQSMPQLYVTGNLYRPADATPGRKFPAVFYVCGHSGCGRNGNKTAYQSHGIWLARHGYVCLVVDTLELGEIGGNGRTTETGSTHHGTYRFGRWWWHSRGYVPSGVECWNGIRGIDYLAARDDVDADRIAVTGISGGGAATFWIAAADERVKVAVPVSGMADLSSYVSNRVIDGHCDCMFVHNTFRWPWTQIASLIAPRALMFTNSDADKIFPMDANKRVINRLKTMYSLYGASDFVDAFVSIGGHAYRKDIRQGAYRFLNMHLKNDARVVTDSEVDLVTGSGDKVQHPIAPEKLRVFPADTDLPADELNTKTDEFFVPMAKVEPPKDGQFDAWKAGLLAELRRVSFAALPERVPPAEVATEAPQGAKPTGDWAAPDVRWLQTEEGIRVPLRHAGATQQGPRVLLAIMNPGDKADRNWLGRLRRDGDAVYVLAPRGIGPTQWTRRNPPNTVERSHALLGRTVDGGRVQDIVAAARYLKAKVGGKAPVLVAGRGAGAVLAAYAALLEPDIAGAVLEKPLLTHMLPTAPQFLNVLRVCDVPEALAMLAPRPLEIRGLPPAELEKVTKAYAAAGKSEALVVRPN